MVFGQKRKILTSAKNDTIGKIISRGAEWCEFQLRSTFQSGVMSALNVKCMRVVKVVVPICCVERL